MKVQSRNNEQLVRVCAHTLEFIHKCTNFSKQISCLVLSLRDYARGITVARPTACKAAASRCYSVMFYYVRVSKFLNPIWATGCFTSAHQLTGFNRLLRHDKSRVSTGLLCRGDVRWFVVIPEIRSDSDPSQSGTYKIHFPVFSCVC